MSFEDNPADDGYELDQCIAEIRQLQVERESLKGDVLRLEGLCTALASKLEPEASRLNPSLQVIRECAFMLRGFYRSPTTP